MYSLKNRFLYKWSILGVKDYITGWGVMMSFSSFVYQIFNFLLGQKQMISRSTEEQTRVDQETKQLSLYHYDGCPFCIRVRNEIERLNLNIELRNTLSDSQHNQDLMEGGGKRTVPCLRIETENSPEWMYESGDIAQYLNSRFA